MTGGKQERVAVVGAGLVGLAVGRQLARSGYEVTVFDKENEPAAHQSGHNSGVVHSGIYYPPGSLKAVLCRRGVGLLEEFCAEHKIAFRAIGKVIVARDPVEVRRLRELEERAARNGVPGVRWLEPAALRELEPNVRGLAALHSPSTAIVDYRAVARAIVDEIATFGGSTRLGAEVLGLRRNSDAAMLRVGEDWHRFDHAVLCAGLQSDQLARRAGDADAPAIVPFRGEYYRLVPGRTDLVRGLVYPVPDPAYPFLGVHITPRIDGTVDIGPNAVLALAREGYRWRDVQLGELGRMLRWPGSRRLFRQHWRTGARELRVSLSRRASIAAARDYLPALSVRDVVRAPAGVRAQAVDIDGTLVDDFRISRLGPVIAVRNAPSPAATSSLAIAEHIAAHIAGQPAA